MAFHCTLMEDPVIASDGFTYNREDIQSWFKSHDKSPHSNEPFEHKNLTPNLLARKMVISWREKHGLPTRSFAAPITAQALCGGSGSGGSAAAQISVSAVMCGFSKQPLQVFCLTCNKAICVSCAIDPARCKSHDTRQLAAIVASVRNVHCAWAQLRDARPQQLRAETERIDAAADAAFQAIREEAAALKLELQRACAGDLVEATTMRKLVQLLADVEVAAASPDAAVAGSDACQCLRRAVTHGPRAPGEDARGGRFEPVAAAAGVGISGSMVRLMGRIVGGAQKAAAVVERVGGVAAVGAGFLRAFGVAAAGKGHKMHSSEGKDRMKKCPACLALDHEGNIVVSDLFNSRIQVFRYSDGQLLRTIGERGSGNGQFNHPWGVALDGAGHLIVVDLLNHRVQVLNYGDGSHVRTIGSKGSGNGKFNCPSGVAIDGDGNIVVNDGTKNGQVQIFRMSDGAHIRSMCSKGSDPGQLTSCGGVAFDAEGNLVVADSGNHRIQVLRYSDGQHLRTIGEGGSDNGQFAYPQGVAFDGAGHLIVVEQGNHRVQVLNYGDGSHVRTIGSEGSGNGQFLHPRGGVAIDGNGRMILCDSDNHRVQVLQ
jgi:DNA-binding beta-propeller fold protein YncE